MIAGPSLDCLESDVLIRIARHRQAQNTAGTLPVSIFVTFAALTVGMIIGWAQQSQRNVEPQGSEAIVLADEARLEPSVLLAAAQ
jgi:hypothetical protein